MKAMISVVVCLSTLVSASVAGAQSAGTAGAAGGTAPDQVSVAPGSALPSPILIPLTGTALTSAGEPRTGEIALRLALYAGQEDTEPLWTESQLITLGLGGTYQAWLGGSSLNGVPPGVFVEDGARWLGIRIDEEPEQLRTVIVAVPYAARAASADTLGTKAATEFVLSENLAQILHKWGFEPSKPPKEPKSPGDIGILSLSTGDSTTPNAVAKWLDNIGTLGEAIGLFESSNRIGIGTAYPSTSLDIYSAGKTQLRVGDAQAQTTGVGGAILFGSKYDNPGNFNTFGKIALEKANATSSNYDFNLAFYTSANGGANPRSSPTLFLHGGSDSVGIGTITPSAPLQVVGTNGSDGQSQILQVTPADNPTRKLFFGYNTTGDIGIIGAVTSGVTFKNVAFPVGNVGIGTLEPAQRLHVAGNALIAGHSTVTGNSEVSGTSTTGSLLVGGAGGASITRDAIADVLVVSGNLKAAGWIEADYQDVAEWVDATEPLAPATVVAAHPSLANHVQRSTGAYDTTVLGVISYQPGLLLGRKGAGKVAVAQSGRVKVRVDASHGAIKPGDLLVASPIPGVAMRSRPTRSGLHRPGTIIGKALEAWPSGAGEILVLLTLQ